MAKGMDGGDTYIKTLIFVFIAFGSFMIAIIAGYFGGVGLYFGQAVVDGDVWQDYKHPCLNESQSQSGCTAGYDTNTSTAAYTDYVAFKEELNPLVLRFLQATFVIFSLLGLVFLFLALRSSGLWKRKESVSTRDEM